MDSSWRAFCIHVHIPKLENTVPGFTLFKGCCVNECNNLSADNEWKKNDSYFITTMRRTSCRSSTGFHNKQRVISESLFFTIPYNTNSFDSLLPDPCKMLGLAGFWSLQNALGSHRISFSCYNFLFILCSYTAKLMLSIRGEVTKCVC